MKEIPLAQRRRMVLYDVVTNPEPLCAELGLPPISPELQEAEALASLNRVKPLVEGFDPILEDHCGFLASMFIQTQKGSAEAEYGEAFLAGIAPEQWEAHTKQLGRMFYATLAAGITLLVEMDVLQYTSVQTEETP